MTEEELSRHDSKTLLQLLLSADARCDALTAERDRLRGACEGAVNWLDALLHQVQATSCEPDDPEAFDEVLMGAGVFMEKARAALKGESQ